MSPEAQRHIFNLAWTLKRIYDLLLEHGTQNIHGEWRVLSYW